MSGFKLPSNWEENEQYLAQVGHFFGALSVIVITALFSIAFHEGWLHVLLALGVGVPATAFKEFFLDLRPPESDSLADSVMDFGFYMFGAAVGVGLTALAFYLSHRHGL